MLLTALALAAALPIATLPPIVPPEAIAIAPRPIRQPDLIGNLYLPDRTGRAPAILLLGGSEGGLGQATAREAAALAAHGYVVLQLSYFGSPGQPPALKSIPIETFTHALDWLKARPEVAADRIGIIGTSKGAEAALLVAARRPDLKIAVMAAPSSVVWPGIGGAEMVTESSWTEGGQPVPFTPYGWTGAWKGIHALYADGLADPAKGALGTIPVERSRAAIILVCGEADTLWPACPMAHAVEARLRQAQYRPGVTVLSYADAGHFVFGTPVDTGSPDAARLASLGGTTDGVIAARTDSWTKVLAALDRVLRPGEAR